MDRADHEALLRRCGLKATRTRLAVLSVLHGAGQPQSTEAIHRAAVRLGPIDLVTVYRTLESFHQAGLVERVRAGVRTWRYHLSLEPDHPSHPHFYCSGCGKLKCLPREVIRFDLERLKESFPAQVDHLQISLEGVCPDCLARIFHEDRQEGKQIGK